MIKIRTLFKYLFCLSIILINCHCLAQTNLEGEGINKNHVLEKKNFHEISYQFPLLLGYSYFHNFNDRIVPGIGIKLGYGYLIHGQYGLLWSENISTHFSFRNLFSRVKNDHLIDYDTGLTWSFMIQHEGARFWGLNFNSQIRVFRFTKVGVDFKLGVIREGMEKLDFACFFYPFLLFSF